MNTQEMEQLLRRWIELIGENPNRQGLQRTPQRASRAWAFLMKGYEQSVRDVINGAIFDVEANHMIIVKDIEIFSMCEHHMLPFFGRCHIGYIPKGKVLGVSKLARLADVFARRLQLQERLTNQIARVIMDSLSPEGVGVVIEARHLWGICVRPRH